MLHRLFIAIFLLSTSYIIVGTYPKYYYSSDPEIPSQSDWVDYGPIFSAGELGEWDYQLFGGFTASAIKKEGVFYLYYQGASGYRTAPDETVTWRAIGVATSPDGINFTKADNNPVITWFPNENGEEGAVSAGTALDSAGNIVIHYGANIELDESSVNADVRAAISPDGLKFTDFGTVIRHDDRDIWGSGDEIFPILTIHDNGQWYVYYLPNGVIESGFLGVAWGDSFDNLTKSKRTRAGFLPVQGWGSGSYAKIAPDNYAIFVNNIRKGTIQAYLMSLKNPAKLSRPVETYRFEEVFQASIYLDEETRTWFMFYRGSDYYGVKMAPAGEKDLSPPTRPGKVQATPTSHSQVKITWDPALDSETGIAVYQIYRDGKNIATAKGWSYTDEGLTELTQYRYQVRAVNYHGVKGPLSEASRVQTLADNSPPLITSVSAFNNQLTVTFNEPITRVTALDISNYRISDGVNIVNAAVEPDGKTIILYTTNHVHNTSYTLHVENLEDRARAPNLNPGQQIEYTTSPISGLVGEWSFNEGSGKIAFDRSNFGNNGELIYLDKPGPEWTDGILGSALQFNGWDDQVMIPLASPIQEAFEGSYSIALWVKPFNIPLDRSPNNEYYSIFSIENMGLSYTSDQRFRAMVHLENSQAATLYSGVYSPNEWHHLTMVVDHSTKNLRLYIDGHEVRHSPEPFQAELKIASRGPIYMGTSDPLEGRYENRLDGLVDQVKIFSKAISGDEVLTIFREENP
jgi:hypothetical protein